MGILLDDIYGELTRAAAKRRRLSDMGSMSRPTKVERMLLIASAAQLIAGPRRNPTRAQLATATETVDRKISSSTLSGWTSMGGFWDKVKSLGRSSGNAAVRAAGFAARNPQIVLPLAAGMIASPFLIKAISEASKTSQAKEEAATSPPPPPTGETVTVAAPPAQASDDESLLGLHNGWDGAGSVDAVVGAMTEEEAELARAGGGSEQESMARMYGASCSMGAASELEHDAYRAAVLRQAARLADGRHPTTREFFVAKRALDRQLRKRGIKVAIPGAQPGRRTL